MLYFDVLSDQEVAQESTTSCNITFNRYKCLRRMFNHLFKASKLNEHAHIQAFNSTMRNIRDFSSPVSLCILINPLRAEIHLRGNIVRKSEPPSDVGSALFIFLLYQIFHIYANFKTGLVSEVCQLFILNAETADGGDPSLETS